VPWSTLIPIEHGSAGFWRISASTPASFRPSASTSFGHLRTTRSPANARHASQTATAVAIGYRPIRSGGSVGRSTTER
jgi:hypothetical protein